MTHPLTRQLAGFLLAVQFLTRLPVPVEGLYTAKRYARIPRWFPAVGSLIGVLTAAVFLVAASVLPPVLAALIATGAGILITGCLHEDGLADLCDGLGSGQPRERVLEIMRDSRIGTFGTAGLGLVLACKIVTLGHMPPDTGAACLIAGHCLSRTACTLVMGLTPYVRSNGRGSGLTTTLSPAAIAIMAPFVLFSLFLLLWFAGLLATIVGLAGLITGTLIVMRPSQRILGGHTGDVLGAVQQVSEVTFLLTVLACL